MSTDAKLVDAINRLNTAMDRLSGNRSFSGIDQGPRFVADGQRDDRAGGDVRAFKEYQRALERQTKEFNDIRLVHKKTFKSMLDGIPILQEFGKTVRSTSERVEEYSRGQSEAYKESAKASSEYVQKMGSNSEALKKFQDKVIQIYESSKKISELSRKRQQLEDAGNAAAKRFSMSQEKLAKDYSNIDAMIEDLQKKRNKANLQERQKYEEPLAKLKELKEIPDSIKKMRQSLGDAEFKRFSQQDPAFKKLYDKFAEAVDQGKSTEEIIESFDDLTEASDRLRGAVEGHSIAVDENSKNLQEHARSFKEAVRNLKRAVAAAVGEAIGKEANILMTRQRLTGSVMRYAAREQALRMGMSETDLLTAMAENRFNLRGLARESGMAAGAGDLLSSGGLNRLSTLSREMGFMGKEALDNLITVSDQMRVLGIDRSFENVKGMMGFYSDTFKELGITAEQMRDLFGQMSREGMLRTGLMGGPRDGRFAAVEAIQEEIEFRGKLARVLNQEIELQQKRVQDLAGLAYGDPAAALKRSLGMELLGQQTGLSASDRQLLGEYMRTGGRSMGTARRRQGAKLFEDVNINVGRQLAGAAQQDDLSTRLLLSTFAGVAGLDPMASVRAFERRGNRTGNIRDMDIMGAPMATTRDPAQDINDATNMVVDTLETMRGALQSSIGAGATAIVSAIGALAASGVGYGFGRLRGGKGGGISGLLNRAKGATGALGKGALRFMGPVGMIGGTALAASSIAKGGASPLSGAASGAGIGAGVGSFFGPLGLAIGAAAGGGLGYLSSLGSARDENPFLKLQMATGGFGAESHSDAELEKIRQLNTKLAGSIRGQKSVTEISNIRNQIKEAQISPASASIAGNLAQLSIMRKDVRERNPVGSISGFSFSQHKETENLKETDLYKERMRHATEDIIAFTESEDITEAWDTNSLKMMRNALMQNDIESEAETGALDAIKDRLAWIGELEEAGLKELVKSNQMQDKHYTEMSENEQRQFIERYLRGSVGSAKQAGIVGMKSASENSR